MKQTFVMRDLPHPARLRAVQAVNQAQVGYVVTIGEPKRKDVQNDKFHAMFNDIAAQVTRHGHKLKSEHWKRLLVESVVFILREEAKAQNKPDPFPDSGLLLPSIDGLRIVQVEVLTRNLTVLQAAQLIEYLYAFGAENDVRWTEPPDVPMDTLPPAKGRAKAVIDAHTGEIT